MYKRRSTYPATDADEFVANVARVTEQSLVAWRAVSLAVFDHISTACQCFVALETGEVSLVPLSIHRLRRLGREYQLYTNRTKDTLLC